LASYKNACIDTLYGPLNASHKMSARDEVN